LRRKDENWKRFELVGALKKEVKDLIFRGKMKIINGWLNSPEYTQKSLVIYYLIN